MEGIWGLCVVFPSPSNWSKSQLTGMYCIMLGSIFLSSSFTEHSMPLNLGSNVYLLSISLSREWANVYWISSTRVCALDAPQKAHNPHK